jgi:hypothetical protein
METKNEAMINSSHIEYDDGDFGKGFVIASALSIPLWGLIICSIMVINYFVK